MANVNKRVSVVWNHFVDVGGQYATCNICQAKLSFRSSVTNLKKHIDKKHPTVRIISRISSSAITQVFSSHVHAASETSYECPAQLSSASPPEISPESLPQIVSSQTLIQPSLSRKYCHEPISDVSYRRDNSKLDIDRKIMNLFIMDFQPFSIVEDRGFRELMAFAFPNYTIPSRKFFADNMLPAIYEKVKTDLKDLVRKQVKSICLTMDTWKSRANDSMIAISGHYIDEEKFALKSFLLDCIPVMKSDTAKHIADAIRVICREWNLTDKVLLAVSDYGANIKSAVERELRWKHFPCYKQTLNLTVNNALKDRNITDLRLKIKGIVHHFKQSNLAWEKFKKYQEEAGATPKRLLQDVPTKWNSYYYMLQRCMEVKEPLNNTMINLGMTEITSSEWLLCEELCLVLQPCEEVSQELSGQKYITGSSVIPITIGLIRALENLGLQENLLPVVDIVRQNLIGNLIQSFLNFNLSNIFCNCMFLDPRFKYYFDDQVVAEETKERIIALAAAQEQDSQVPVPSTSCETKSIWLDFDQKMQVIQPGGITAHSRATVEVQRYYDDKILARTECPMKWWREHRTVYPNLYKIAATKLNTMASSFPWEQVLSAGGNILSDRKNRLGVGKLQQLVFLHQNM